MYGPQGIVPIQWHLGLRSHAKDREGGGWGQDECGLDYLTGWAVPIHLYMHTDSAQMRFLSRKLVSGWGIEVFGYCAS